MQCVGEWILKHLSNPKPKTQNPKPKTQNPKPKTQNPKLFKQKFCDRKRLFPPTIDANTDGTAPGQLKQPQGVTFDHHRQRVVISDLNHRVQYFTRQEIKFESYVGGLGNQRGELDHPMGMCVQPFTHHLLVCDSNHHQLQIYSEDSQPLGVIRKTYLGEFNHAPARVSCAGDGSIYVADMRELVQLYDPRGRYLSSLPADLPHEVCSLSHHFSPSSSASSLVLVAQQNFRNVRVWSANGEQEVSSLCFVEQPCSMCVDMNGYLCVAFFESKMMRVYDPRNGFVMLQELRADGSVVSRSEGMVSMCVDESNVLMGVRPGCASVQFFE